MGKKKEWAIGGILLFLLGGFLALDGIYFSGDAFGTNNMLVTNEGWLGIILAVAGVVIIVYSLAIKSVKNEPPKNIPPIQPPPYQQSPIPYQQRRFCVFCGREIPIDSNLCPYCGKQTPRG